MAEDVFVLFNYRSAFSAHMSISSSTRTKHFVLLVLVLCVSSRFPQCACAYACVAGVLVTFMLMLVLMSK